MRPDPAGEKDRHGGLHLRTSTTTLRNRAPSPIFLPFLASAIQRPLIEPFFWSSESRINAALGELHRRGASVWAVQRRDQIPPMAVD